MSVESHAVSYRRFMGPRYWPTWILLGWMKLAAVLPYPWQITVGKWFGRIGMRLAAFILNGTTVYQEEGLRNADAASRRRDTEHDLDNFF